MDEPPPPGPFFYALDPGSTRFRKVRLPFPALREWPVDHPRLTADSSVQSVCDVPGFVLRLSDDSFCYILTFLDPWTIFRLGWVCRDFREMSSGASDVIWNSTKSDTAFLDSIRIFWCRKLGERWKTKWLAYMSDRLRWHRFESRLELRESFYYRLGRRWNYSQNISKSPNLPPGLLPIFRFQETSGNPGLPAVDPADDVNIRGNSREEWGRIAMAPFRLMEIVEKTRDLTHLYSNWSFGEMRSPLTPQKKNMCVFQCLFMLFLPLVATILTLVGAILLAVIGKFGGSMSSISVVVLSGMSLVLLFLSVAAGIVLNEGVVPCLRNRRVQLARSLARGLPRGVLQTAGYFWETPKDCHLQKGTTTNQYRTFGEAVMSEIPSNDFFLSDRFPVAVILVALLSVVPSLELTAGLFPYVQFAALAIPPSVFLVELVLVVLVYLLYCRHSDFVSWGNQEWNIRKSYWAAIIGVIVPVWLLVTIFCVIGAFRLSLGTYGSSAVGALLSSFLCVGCLWVCCPATIVIAKSIHAFDWEGERDDDCCDTWLKKVCFSHCRDGGQRACRFVRCSVYLLPGLLCLPFVAGVMFFFAVPAWAAWVVIVVFSVVLLVGWIVFLAMMSCHKRAAGTSFA